MTTIWQSICISMQQSKRRGNVLAFWHTLRCCCRCCLCAALPTHIIDLPVDWSDRFNLITNYELFVFFFLFPPSCFCFYHCCCCCCCCSCSCCRVALFTLTNSMHNFYLIWVQCFVFKICLQNPWSESIVFLITMIMMIMIIIIGIPSNIIIIISPLDPFGSFTNCWNSSVNFVFFSCIFVW